MFRRFFRWPQSLATAPELTSRKIPSSRSIHVMYRGHVSLFSRSSLRNSHRCKDLVSETIEEIFKNWEMAPRVYIANTNDAKFGITTKYIYSHLSFYYFEQERNEWLNHLRFLRPTRGFALGELELELLEDDSLRLWLPETNKRVEINPIVQQMM